MGRRVMVAGIRFDRSHCNVLMAFTKLYQGKKNESQLQISGIGPDL